MAGRTWFVYMKYMAKIGSRSYMYRNSSHIRMFGTSVKLMLQAFNTMVQLIQLYDYLIQAAVHCKINRQNSGIIITCMHTQSKNWWKGKAHLSWNKWSKL